MNVDEKGDAVPRSRGVERLAQHRVIGPVSLFDATDELAIGQRMPPERTGIGKPIGHDAEATAHLRAGLRTHAAGQIGNG